jgi:hypothetical protein
MAGTTRSSGEAHAARITLNSDGLSHPLLNAASVFTLLMGLSSFSLGLYLHTVPASPRPWAIAAASTGLTGLLVGLVSQMMSATREERVLIVAGIIAAFVGLALGLANGGFS